MSRAFLLELIGESGDRAELCEINIPACATLIASFIANCYSNSSQPKVYHIRCESDGHWSAVRPFSGSLHAIIRFPAPELRPIIRARCRAHWYPSPELPPVRITVFPERSVRMSSIGVVLPYCCCKKNPIDIFISSNGFLGMSFVLYEMVVHYLCAFISLDRIR